MKTIIYSSHEFEKSYFEQVGTAKHELFFCEQGLSVETAILSKGFDAVGLFANDDASAEVLELLKANGVRFIVLRSAGYNNVDLHKARQLGLRVARVPAYSPFSVAEHAVALMLALNRKLIPGHSRLMNQNFSLDGLTGFDMNGKTVGIVGTGKIGSVVASILHGFGCRIIAFDQVENEDIKQKYGVEYTDLESLCRKSDIITLHVPLNEHTKYLIDETRIAQMKPRVMLINTARGGLIKTSEVIQALKVGHIGYLGMDVYEAENGLFFKNHSGEILQDDTFSRLLSFPNVLITGHQGFLTDTALKNIAETTMHNLDCFGDNDACENEITA